ncbi:MAG: hypothetical protein WCI92_09745 [Bacteroidota bacterium]
MRLYLLLFWTLLFILLNQTVEAQKVLLLQKSGNTQRFLYNIGDKISIRTGIPEFQASGEITYLDDSVFTIDRNFTFALANVCEVDRKRHWFYVSWPKFFLASALYAGGSMINRTIHDEEPLVDNTIYIVSGSLAALGATSYFLRYKKCKTEDNWHLKVLDYDIFKEKKAVEE